MEPRIPKVIFEKTDVFEHKQRKNPYLDNVPGKNQLTKKYGSKKFVIPKSSVSVCFIKRTLAKRQE